MLLLGTFASREGQPSVFVRLQFIPALLAFNAAVVIFLLLLTLLSGRVYCPVICPLGILLDNLHMVEINSLQGAMVADKVVGQAAAALMLHGGVRRVHAEVISGPAYRMLNEARVRVSYEKRVPEIRNRDNSGLCPLEALYRDCPDKEQYLQRLRETIAEVQKNPSQNN